MTLELRVLSGARAGESARYEQPVIAVGRHPQSDLRFDTERDLDVSARHAEIRVVEGAYVVRDAGSTNGTFVNGVRVAGEQVLHDGDVIGFGATGPKAVVRYVGAAAAAGGVRRSRDASIYRASPRPEQAPSITARVAVAVRSHTRRLQRLVAIAAGLAVLLAAGAYWTGQREGSRRTAELEALLRRNDSVSAELRVEVQRLTGRVTGLDSALAAAQAQRERLGQLLQQARTRGSTTSVTALEARLRNAEIGEQRVLEAARMDHSAIAAANGPGVVLIAVEEQDGRSYAGTGFCVDRDGLIVTSKHVVLEASGAPVRRIAVIFSDTRDWLPARLVRVDTSADLALLRIVTDGSFPTVAGLAPGGPPRVGAPVALIGYPLGTGTPMEGSGTAVTARSTLGAGTVSKVLDDLVQVDAYAGEGSSGSPVFDASGRVIGVVYGGAQESGGRIVYAVPSRRLAALLGTAPR